MRKAGKLPGATLSQAYDLEYGSAEIEVHAEDLTTADRVLVVDDVLATGGTAEASVQLIRRAGAEVRGPGRTDGARLPRRPCPAGTGPGRRPAGGAAHGLTSGDARESHTGNTARAGPEESGARLGRSRSRPSSHPPAGDPRARDGYHGVSGA
ncbi:hypothetical protein GCM10023238_27770 [Streptomyces heliomycini]